MYTKSGNVKQLTETTHTEKKINWQNSNNNTENSSEKTTNTQENSKENNDTSTDDDSENNKTISNSTKTNNDSEEDNEIILLSTKTPTSNSDLEELTKQQTQFNPTVIIVTKPKRKTTQQNYSKPKRIGWFQQDNNMMELVNWTNDYELYAVDLHVNVRFTSIYTPKDFENSMKSENWRQIFMVNQWWEKTIHSIKGKQNILHLIKKKQKWSD